jgi:hypothetical protein
MIEVTSPEGFSDRPMRPDLDAYLEPVFRAWWKSPLGVRHTDPWSVLSSRTWEQESEPVDMTCGGNTVTAERRAPALDGADVEMLVITRAAARKNRYGQPREEPRKRDG